MDPVTGSLVLKAGSAIAGGVGAASSAKAKKQDAEINAYIGRTRAIQTSTAAAASLSEELANVRTVFAQNGQQPSVGTFEVMKELRRIRGQERDVEYGNRMQESYDQKRAARGYGSASKFALLGGFAQAGPSLFDIYQRKKP